MKLVTWSLILFLFFGKLAIAKSALLTTKSLSANLLPPGLLWGLLSCLQHVQKVLHIANSFELFWLGCSHLAEKGFALSGHSLRFQTLDCLSLLASCCLVILCSLSRILTLFVPQCPVSIEGWDFPLPTVICFSSSEDSFHLLFLGDISSSRHFLSQCLHCNHCFLQFHFRSVLLTSDGDCSSSTAWHPCSVSRRAAIQQQLKCCLKSRTGATASGWKRNYQKDKKMLMLLKGRVFFMSRKG